MEIKGRYNEAIVFTDVIEDTAKQQVYDLCNLEFLQDSKIRMMPDLHAGKGCTVGTTMTITDKIVPNFVGVDLGCGMICVNIDVKKKDIDFHKLDQVIRRNVPSGMKIRRKAHRNANQIPFTEILAPINEGRARNSVGTLGGGNHFIEINEDSKGKIYLVIHSGSRNPGKQISDHYQELAIQQLDSRPDRENLDRNTAYLEGEQMQDYLHDVGIAQQYAAVNRQTMAEVIMRGMGWNDINTFDTIHNYVDLDNMILRKGAISAQKDEIVIIPMNMRDGSLICRGKGNPDWNFSGPHGAGRTMSRTQARRHVKLAEFEDAMQDVWSTSVTKSTIDESPFAYKKMEDIIRHIGDSVEIVEIIKPLYNYKA
ncbi:hypothetical protein E2C16_02435 [Sporosarcina pasteurii]|nr:hypothetical protein E2C16_02435 [Sporosarcina pasteurii]